MFSAFKSVYQTVLSRSISFLFSPIIVIINYDSTDRTENVFIDDDSNDTAENKDSHIVLVEIISLFLNDLFQIKPVMMIIIMIDDDDTRNIARRSGLIDVD